MHNNVFSFEHPYRICAAIGIHPKSVYFTDTRELHRRIIASGTADCGMGIYSAAKTYDLDFLELWDEEYDFLVAESAIGDPRVKAFLEALHSEEFANRLNALGGYTLNQGQ